MIIQKRSLLYILLSFALNGYSKLFPTGMKWEEIIVMPMAGMEVDTNSKVYEIGNDTLINDIIYKKVWVNGVFKGSCIREDNQKVWLITDEYPREILLYDFDWDSGQPIVTEYLKRRDDGECDVLTQSWPSGDYLTTLYNGKNYQYYRDGIARTVIRAIGNVSELNRNSCLLGYMEPHTILPGMEYVKVSWIERDGCEIFRSESSDEWTTNVPKDSEDIQSIISPVSTHPSTNQSIHDLQGRRLTVPPVKGLYIQNGRKVIVK